MDLLSILTIQLIEYWRFHRRGPIIMNHSRVSVNMPHVSILATTGLQQTSAFNAHCRINRAYHTYISVQNIILIVSIKCIKQFKRNTVPLSSTKLFQSTNLMNVSTSHCMESRMLNIVRPKQQKQESHTHLTPKLTFFHHQQRPVLVS